jgi:hypothetical protein
MNGTFETIGLEVPSEKAFNYLAERAGDQGEATQLNRRGAVLHGRCWKLGEGLEVWTVLYESGVETDSMPTAPGFGLVTFKRLVLGLTELTRKARQSFTAIERAPIARCCLNCKT